MLRELDIRVRHLLLYFGSKNPSVVVRMITIIIVIVAIRVRIATITNSKRKNIAVVSRQSELQAHARVQWHPRLPPPTLSTLGSPPPSYTFPSLFAYSWDLLLEKYMRYVHRYVHVAWALQMSELTETSDESVKGL